MSPSRALRRLVAALALVGASAAPAPAQEAEDAREPRVVIPSDLYSEEDLADFRDCRVAVFYHLDGPPDPEARIPREAARALLDQMTFVMAQSVNRAPARSFDDAARRQAFIERFMLGFTRAVAEQRERFSDLQERERTLAACMGGVWEAVKVEIEALMRNQR